MQKFANRDGRDFGWEIAHAADFPRHDGTSYRGLRVRRWGLGFAHRSRATLCRAVPNPSVTIRNFCIAVLQCTLPGFTHTHGPNRGGGHLQQLAVLLEDQPLLHHAGSRVDHARLRRQHLVTIDGGGEQLRQWARRRREKCEVVASRGRSVRSIQNTPSDMRRNPPPHSLCLWRIARCGAAPSSPPS